MPDDDRPIDRRRFFRAGLRELLKPITKAAEPLEQVIRQIGAMDDEAAAAAAHARAKQLAVPPSAALPPAPVNPFAAVLRPPGALREPQFKDACSKCAVCVRVCPADCIVIDPAGLRGNGLPFIDADAAACVLCDGTPCMTECPTGALVVTAVGDVDMGTANWHADRCVRTTAGQDCTVCVDVCPVGEVAIRLADDGRGIHVIDDGCTGCGLCQNRCPTLPKSITVRPAAAAARASSPVPRSRPR